MSRRRHTEPRRAGWDSKVRARASREYGSLAALAAEAGVPVAEHAMVTWSRLVSHFGGTAEVETYLNEWSP